jgi:hypothetical protein
LMLMGRISYWETGYGAAYRPRRHPQKRTLVKHLNLIISTRMRLQAESAMVPRTLVL